MLHAAIEGYDSPRQPQIRKTPAPVKVAVCILVAAILTAIPLTVAAYRNLPVSSPAVSDLLPCSGLGYPTDPAPLAPCVQQ